MDNFPHGREGANRIYYPTSPPTMHISVLPSKRTNGRQRHKAEWGEAGSGPGGANAEYPEENANPK